MFYTIEQGRLFIAPTSLRHITLELLLTPDLWLSLITLTFLEIILGVDNLVFISIVSADVPKHQQKLARRAGLLGALVMRLALLASVFWIIGLSKPVMTLWQHSFSIRDFILIAGGLFLLIKATLEMHHSIEPDVQTDKGTQKKNLFFAIVQIMLFDIIFSLDSILTAVGLTRHFWVMAVAILIAIALMLMASEMLHKFISTHPTVKMLALSFLLLIGMVLLADGFQFHIPRAYIYFAIAFSIFVEFMNSLVRKKKIH